MGAGPFAFLVCKGDVEACADENNGGEGRKAGPGGRKLFQEYNDCQTDDPHKVHDASGKEQQHQRPAAPQAIGAVHEAEAERAQPAGEPMSR